MEVADDNGPEILDFKLKIVEKKINVDDYSKVTNIFTYVLLQIVTQIKTSVTFQRVFLSDYYVFVIVMINIINFPTNIKSSDCLGKQPCSSNETIWISWKN